MSFSTILIASPSVIIREGLKALLHADAGLFWVGDASDPDEMMARVQDLRVDLLVLDFDLLSDADTDGLSQIRAAAPETRIVALADTWHDPRIVAALRSGVHGFISRRSTASEIGEALRAAQSGTLLLRPAAADLVVQQLQPPPAAVENLSPRELDILRLLARGLPNKVIAQQLFISEHTVKFHIRSILDKFNAANRTEAVRIGLERGLISI